MRFRKFVSLWALLALMLGQVALAQHSATHIDHGFSHEVMDSHGEHDDHQHDEENQKHNCPECLLTKSLQVAFYNTASALIIIPSMKSLPIEQRSLTISTNLYNSNSPRAPPTTLI